MTRWRAGRPLSLTEPVDPDDVGGAERMAGRLLAAGDRSRSEVERRLRARGYSQATATRAVERLAERGWIDDGRVAENLSRRRLERGYGRRRIIAELVARGIPPETVSEAAQQVGEDQTELALLTARRLLAGAPRPLPAPDLRRVAGALQRRGFTARDIHAALRQLTALTATGEGDALE